MLRKHVSVGLGVHLYEGTSKCQLPRIIAILIQWITNSSYQGVPSMHLVKNYATCDITPLTPNHARRGLIVDVSTLLE